MRCWAAKCGGCGRACDAACFAGKVLCQHGDTECGGDDIEICAAEVAPRADATELVRFIACLEGHGGEHCANCTRVAPRCAEAAGIRWELVQQCLASPRLDALRVAAARKTADYGPSREGTPWVQVNGVHLANESLLLGAVCDAIDGPRRPAGCP